jgi:chromatin remodeling complex protein RSC6
MSAAASTPAPAKTARKVTKKTEETAAPAPVVAAPAPAEAAPVKKAATKKASAAPVAAPAPVATPVATPAPAPSSAPAPAADAAKVASAAAAAPVVEEVRLEAEAKAITSRLLAVRETVSELISEAKRLEKKAARVQKVADKRRRRRAPVEGEEGKPVRISIFQIPTDISPHLCAFLGRPSGSQESRSNVTKFITNYVKENNLKNKHDINADAKLNSLLGLKEGDKLTYFNLQKYLNVHYLKKDKTVVATA